jgi:hypothetical protein
MQKYRLPEYKIFTDTDGELKKKCPRCDGVFLFTPKYFGRNRAVRNGTGLKGICRTCINKYVTSGIQGEKNKKRGIESYHKRKAKFGQALWNQMERERIKNFWERNPDKYRAYLEGKKKNYFKHRERHRAFAQTPEGKQKQSAKARNYRNKGSNRVLINLRKRLHGCLTYKARRNHKVGTFQNMVGVGKESLLRHIESFWQTGMSWENYGRKAGVLTWHVDHIVPCAHFYEDFNSGDLTKIQKASQLLNHYTNLFPLWGPENQSKGDNAPEWVIVMGKSMWSNLHEKAYKIEPDEGIEIDLEDANRQD